MCVCVYVCVVLCVCVLCYVCVCRVECYWPLPFGRGVLGSVCVAGGRRRDAANVLLAPVCVCVCARARVCGYGHTWTTFATCMPYALHMRMHIGCVYLVHEKRVCACQEPVCMSRAQV